jgi:synapsin
MSILMMQERVIMFSELNSLKKKHGKKFPLIDQMYFPNYNNEKKPTYDKFVMKIGHSHAGLGKIKVTNEQVYNDVVSIVEMSKDYFTCEPFINYVGDLRIQKIGDHYRCFERRSLIGNWKVNGSLI